MSKMWTDRHNAQNLQILQLRREKEDLVELLNRRSRRPHSFARD